MKRMMKKASKEANPPDSKVPDFLKHCQNSGKRLRDVDGNAKMALMPEWGIYAEHSVFGSALLIVD